MTKYHRLFPDTTVFMTPLTASGKYPFGSLEIKHLSLSPCDFLFLPIPHHLRTILIGFFILGFPH